MRNTSWVLTLVLALASAACGRVALEADRGKLERGAVKADGSNSCKDQCGGQAPAGCWCDAACVQQGDCCQDKGLFCDGQAGSCKGYCGKQSPGGCFCDAQCATFGDCCGDKAQQCGGTSCPDCATVCDPTFVGDVPAGCPGMSACGCGTSCSTAKDCGACLGIAGCNWTGGTCAETCLQDTDCYGPGNPAASACPAGPPACSILDEQECLARSDCEPMWGVCLMYCQPGDPGCCAFDGCKPKGCTPVVCAMYCEYGMKKDANGCEICECNDPPAGCDGLGTEQCKARSDCQWVEPTAQPGSPPPLAYCAKKQDCTGAWIDASNGNCYGPNDGALPDECCDSLRKAQCEQTNKDYVAALTKAKACSPFVAMPQCTQYVNEDLLCPICGTFVNDKSSLLPHETRFKTLRCAATGGPKGWWGCPPVVCDPPLSGLCDVATSSCQDVFQ